MNDLFPPNFLGAIAGLSLVVKPAPARMLHGAHLSPRTGASLEFRDFQSYVPGDDLRRVDWNVYQRTRHLFLRRYQHPTSVPVNVLVDASESMFLEDPSRWTTAARLAAAVASAALAGLDTVNVAILDARGASARRVTGRRQFVELLGELARQRPAGPCAVSSIDRLLPTLGMARSRGVLVIISDFFDPAGAESITVSLRQVPHRLVLLRVTQPWDEKPELQLGAGDAELLDCESSARMTVSPQRETYRRYLEAYHGFFGELEAYVRTRGATMTRFDASAETIPQLQHLFPHGVLTV